MHNDHNNDHNEVGEVTVGEVTVGDHTIVDEEAVCALRHLAFREARRIGLDDDDAHDTAMEFVLRAMQQKQCEPRKPCEGQAAAVILTRLILRSDLPPDQMALWLRRCARNFASNWRRSLLCRKRYEAAFSDAGFNGETLFLSPSAHCAVSAEEAALFRLLRRDLHAACGKLPPASRVLFERFHLHEDSMAEIALSAGKSENAIKQSVYRLRRHVRTALVQQGHEPL